VLGVESAAFICLELPGQRGGLDVEARDETGHDPLLG
jgi:hypothetical protein